MSTQLTDSEVFARIQSGEWDELDFATWLEHSHGATRAEAICSTVRIAEIHGIEYARSMTKLVNTIMPGVYEVK